MGKKHLERGIYMTFNFAKTLMMGSVITMGAFGLIACGDDSSSGAPADEQPGSSASADATQDISISATNLGSRTRGIGINAEVIFSGNFDIDLSAQQTGEATDISFTAISYDVAYGTVVPGESYRSLGDLTDHQEVRFPTKMIDLGSANSAGVSISLANPALDPVGCGTYTLVVKVSAVDTEGNDKVSNQFITFDRPESFCKTSEPESSSSEDVVEEVPMTNCQVELSTNMAPGLDLATCTAVDAASAATADVIFTAANGDITMSSGNGAMFGKLDADYSVGYWPETANNRTLAYKSDFPYRAIANASFANMIESAEQIYVIQTAAGGFYALGFATETSYKKLTNNDYSFSIKLYKPAQ